MRVIPQQLSSVPPPSHWQGWPAHWRNFDGKWIAQIGGVWCIADGIWRRMRHGSVYWYGTITSVDGTHVVSIAENVE